MRNKILLYLFVFTALIAVFIYVNDKKVLNAREQRISQLEEENQSLQSSLDEQPATTAEQPDFSLVGNEEAMSYFEDRGLEAEEVLQKIEDNMISRNKADEDNDLVPFDGMNGPMRINKIHVLNHKWIIASFTDGKYWGELFLSYEIDKDGNLTLTTEKSFLYPQA